jgi:hypothetical protein
MMCFTRQDIDSQLTKKLFETAKYIDNTQIRAQDVLNKSTMIYSEATTKRQQHASTNITNTTAAKTRTVHKASTYSTRKLDPKK